MSIVSMTLAEVLQHAASSSPACLGTVRAWLILDCLMVCVIPCQLRSLTLLPAA